MALKPWYTVVTPREDLRKNKPLDASEFAVHLDHVREGRAPSVYQDPAEFFERTYLTKNLRDLSAQVVRRLSGIRVETSAVFNLSTQFGGGKTHSLTLIYHLAKHGSAAKGWKGVSEILSDAQVNEVPAAETAVFVGTEFDSVRGRGGDDGTPLRRTPWGEIAFQLDKARGFERVKAHDESLTAPGGDVIEKMLPAGRPTLILMDELMNYVSRSRKSGLGAQIYNFLHNLSEVARGRNDVVLAVSIPAAELEMTAEDQSDFERLQKLLDRLGKAVIMSAEAESSEIIRRRLFDWQGVPAEARDTIEEYAAWIQGNKESLPSWFPVNNAQEALRASYPLHPSLLSVFERKWRGLPRFQQTRGMLRLLALWVAHAYREGYNNVHKDPLISLGTAPLEDPLFRAALFHQLGEERLEPAVTTDIAGKDHAHALRLDAEARMEIKKARLHRKIATCILMESNGGQSRAEATLPEIRLAVAEPGLNIGSVDQCLETLTDHCYFLNAERNRYRFTIQPNLNKLLADRRASISSAQTHELILAEIQKLFGRGNKLEPPVYFPKKSSDIADRAALTLVVLAPEQTAAEPATVTLIEALNREYGMSPRVFRSALIWAVAEDANPMLDEGRKRLAWTEIAEDTTDLHLNESQRHQIEDHLERAERDLKEAIWRAYKNIFLLGPDNTMRKIDLGLTQSGAAPSLVDLILSRLRQEDLVAESVGPMVLTRYWPPALPEWSTRAIRDAFFSSPKFPRLLKPDALKDTFVRGLEGGLWAYVGKAGPERFEPFIYKRTLAADDIEFSADLYLISPERAESYLASLSAASLPMLAPEPTPAPTTPGGTIESPAATPAEISTLRWSGEISSQKWMNFYTKVLSRWVTSAALKLVVNVEITSPTGIPAGKAEETKVALRELGLSETVDVIRKP
ncbi:ATP-binding protein [Steroidobacter sp. S1-65]|uniref:ATP-binding protein n=1 Tax=Steroidobacter gossypii TaxID=2805490 RepID=A0ABS1WZU0_9GAMM|nr:DUF499 domain-containing protein [Steroidobacter gossypii]MBM0106501.1 ATP-binding protein [Steroidobacter gossypii]